MQIMNFPPPLGGALSDGIGKDCETTSFMQSCEVSPIKTNEMHGERLEDCEVARSIMMDE